MPRLNLKEAITEILKLHPHSLPVSFSEKSAEFFLENSEIHCSILTTDEKDFIRCKFWPKFNVSVSELTTIVRSILQTNYDHENTISVLPVINNKDELYILYDREWKNLTEYREVYEEVIQIDKNIPKWMTS